MRCPYRSGDESVAFIEANRERPFFLHLAHTMPHLPLGASAEFAAAAPKGGLYGGVVQEIDAVMGRILDCLDRHRLAANTLVLFTSDNGPWAKPRPGRSSTWTPTHPRRTTSPPCTPTWWAGWRRCWTGPPRPRGWQCDERGLVPPLDRRARRLERPPRAAALPGQGRPILPAGTLEGLVSNAVAA